MPGQGLKNRDMLCPDTYSKRSDQGFHKRTRGYASELERVLVILGIVALDKWKKVV